MLHLNTLISIAIALDKARMALAGTPAYASIIEAQIALERDLNDVARQIGPIKIEELK